eukprot:scaffold5678_cov27-Tisochrysis_lutea.AAC.1
MADGKGGSRSAPPGPPVGISAALDADGHILSPALRAQQREIAVMHASAPKLAAEAGGVFEAAFAEGLRLYEASEPSAARERFVACYVLAREMRFHEGEVDALNLAALCYLELGQPERALEYFRGCYRLCDKFADGRGAVVALGNVGRVLMKLTRLGEAEQALAQAADVASALGDLPMWVHALGRLGTIQLRRQRPVEAQRSLAQAIGLATALDDPQVEAPLLQRLAAAVVMAAEQPITHEANGNASGSCAADRASSCATATDEVLGIGASGNVIADHDVVDASPGRSAAGRPSANDDISRLTIGTTPGTLGNGVPENTSAPEPKESEKNHGNGPRLLGPSLSDVADINSREGNPMTSHARPLAGAVDLIARRRDAHRAGINLLRRAVRLSSEGDTADLKLQVRAARALPLTAFELEGFLPMFSE